MAKKHNEFLEYVLDLLEEMPGIDHRGMFGGYAIRKYGLAFALIIDNEIYFKVDDTNIDDFKALDSRPFTYEKKGKVIVVSNWSLPDQILEDSDLLPHWVEKSYQVALRKKKTKN